METKKSNKELSVILVSALIMYCFAWRNLEHPILFMVLLIVSIAFNTFVAKNVSNDNTIGNLIKTAAVVASIITCIYLVYFILVFVGMVTPIIM